MSWCARTNASKRSTSVMALAWPLRRHYLKNTGGGAKLQTQKSPAALGGRAVVLVGRTRLPLLVHELSRRARPAVASRCRGLDGQVAPFHRKHAFLLDGVAAGVDRGRDDQLGAVPRCLRHLFGRAASSLNRVLALRSVQVVHGRNRLVTLHACERQGLGVLSNRELVAEAAPATAAAAAPATTTAATGRRRRRGGRIHDPLTREIRLGLRSQARRGAKHQHHSNDKEIPSHHLPLLNVATAVAPDAVRASNHTFTVCGGTLREH